MHAICPITPLSVGKTLSQAIALQELETNEEYEEREDEFDINERLDHLIDPRCRIIPYSIYSLICSR